MLKSECYKRAQQQRDRGISNIVVVAESHTRLFPIYTRELCSCKNVEVVAAVHGRPGDEKEPFREVRQILNVAPRCTNVAFHNFRCSGFDSEQAALAEADKLARELANNGYGGKVTVKGYQTVHLLRLSRLKSENKCRGGGGGAVDQWSLIKEQISNSICDMVNTPIGFQVCAEGVTMELDPCEVAGEVSVLDKAACADTSVTCLVNGKRANQKCSYVALKDIPDSKLNNGISLRDYFKADGFGEDGCNARAGCLCKWTDPEVCS